MLSVPKEYQLIFKSDKTQITVDFMVQDLRGNIGVYEIMAYPKEDPVGWAKLDMLTQQYPNVPVHPVTKKMYHRLRARFENRINSSQSLAGWENSKDNLYTNPEKFGDKD